MYCGVVAITRGGRKKRRGMWSVPMFGELYDLSHYSPKQNKYLWDDEALGSQDIDIHLDPVKELLRAVLQRAIVDALGNTGHLHGGAAQAEQKKALTWLTSDTQSSTPQPFTFQWICEELCLCPRTIRKRVLIAKEKGLQYYPGRSNYKTEKNKAIQNYPFEDDE